MPKSRFEIVLASTRAEGRVAPLALERGEFPLVGGDAQAGSLTMADAAAEHWDRVVVMRAPSRLLLGGLLLTVYLAIGWWRSAASRA